MASAKEQILKEIEAYPEDIDADEIFYRLYVNEQIRQARNEYQQGQFVTTAQLKADAENW